MTDGDLIRHLLDSPIDNDPKRTKGSETTGAPDWVWFVGAMLVGGLLVLAGYVVGGRGAEPVAAEETTTTTAEPVTAIAFPAGFVPLDSRFGARVERVLFSPVGVYVTVSTVSTFSVEGEASAFVGGAWDLILGDGARISSVDQTIDALVPGYLTVRFGLAGYEPEDVEGIEYTALGITSGEDAPLRVPGVVLPGDGSVIALDEILQHTTADGTGLVVRDIEISNTGASMKWALASGTAARAHLSAFASTLTADGAIHRLVGTTGQETFFGGFGFGTVSILHGAWQTDGDIAFAPLSDDGPLPTGVPLDLYLNITLTWISFTPVSAPPIPIGDAPVVVVD